MFHKIMSVIAMPDFKLNIQFDEGVIKIYDVKLLFDRFPEFKRLKNNPEKFYDVTVDAGGYGIIRNDELDLSCDELWESGLQQTMKCSFAISE